MTSNFWRESGILMSKATKDRSPYLERCEYRKGTKHQQGDLESCEFDVFELRTLADALVVVGTHKLSATAQ
jgi:hypothetical protein